MPDGGERQSLGSESTDGDGLGHVGDSVRPFGASQQRPRQRGAHKVLPDAVQVPETGDETNRAAWLSSCFSRRVPSVLRATGNKRHSLGGAGSCDDED